MATTRKKVIRGVQNIRTLAGRSGQSLQPYQAYLRIGALEMEKARRTKERESAMTRVDNIDTRCREIEMEKKALLKIISAGRQEDCQVKTGDKRCTPGNFKLRY